MRGSIAILIAISIAFAGGQMILPRMAENQLAAGIRETAGPAELVQVDIDAFPAWQLLQGRVPTLAVDVRQAHINDLKIEAFMVDGHNVVLDAQALRQGKGLSVKAADSLQVSTVVSEDDLNAYIWEKNDNARNFHIVLDPQWTGLKGSVSVLGKALEINVKGHFAVLEHTRVAFLVDEVTMQNATLPRFIIDALAPHWPVEIDLSQSPVPLEVRDLRVENHRLFIYGQRPGSLPQTGAGS